MMLQEKQEKNEITVDDFIKILRDVKEKDNKGHMVIGKVEDVKYELEHCRATSHKYKSALKYNVQLIITEIDLGGIKHE